MDKNSIILFSQGNIANWAGLPKNLSIVELIKLLGNPTETSKETLGYYPAIKYQFTFDDNKEGLIAFVRQENVILIDALKLPEASILNELPEPDAILPHEILVDNAYATEFIFSKIGLNLTVARHFDKNVADKIIRCRGFEKLNSPAEFDTRYYKSFENSISF